MGVALTLNVDQRCALERLIVVVRSGKRHRQDEIAIPSAPDEQIPNADSLRSDGKDLDWNRCDEHLCDASRADPSRAAVGPVLDGVRLEAPNAVDVVCRATRGSFESADAQWL